MWVLFCPGEEIERGVGGGVPGELAVGVCLEVLGLEEGGEGLVDGVADVEAAGVCDLVVFVCPPFVYGVRMGFWALGDLHVLQRALNTLVCQGDGHLVGGIQTFSRFGDHPH